MTYIQHCWQILLLNNNNNNAHDLNKYECINTFLTTTTTITITTQKYNVHNWKDSKPIWCLSLSPFLFDYHTVCTEIQESIDQA